MIIIRNAASYGFTLIELLATIAVASIIVIIGIPSIASLTDKYAIKSTAEDMHMQLLYARVEAIKRSEDVTLTLMVSDDSAQWCFGLKIANQCDCTETDPNAADYCALDDVAKIFNSADYPNINITSPGTESTSTITFDYRTGTTDSLGITLESRQSKKANIIVSALGTARLCSPDGSINDYPSC